MTLIELMIVVAIVAILATIAVGNYRSHVLRSNRAEATAALLRIQVAQEKYYLSKNTYSTSMAALGLGNSNSTERGLYTIQLQLGATPDTYTATATAAGSQVADRECPAFSINQAGTKSPTPGTSNRCWR